MIRRRGMLLHASSSPRRLASLAVLVFLLTLILFKGSRYPNLRDAYPFTGLAPADTNGQQGSGASNGQKGESAQARPKYKTTAQPQKVVVPPWTNVKAFNGSDGPIRPLRKLAFEDQENFVRNLTFWDTLEIDNHWPSWDSYDDLDYDPNRWEGFDWELGYYTGNGIDQILESEIVPEPYLPYPSYNSMDWKQEWKGEHVPCEGARGLNVQDSIQDIPKAWRSRTPNFPAPSVGSFDVVGLDEGVCFDRFNRYSAFGYGLHDNNPHKGWEKPQDQPYWSDIRWGQLQDSCLLRNKDRYVPDARAPMSLASKKDLDSKVDFFDEHRLDQFNVKPAYHPRTAILFRTWEGYEYQENDLQAIRALITETSLLSGAEYQVFIFVNVKQKDADIYNDPQVYQKILRESVPEEFRDIAILWTEKVCEEWYPKVGDWQVYWQQFMPVQWFSKTHPEFDYVWNWETDARYTGSHYEFLEKMAEFSRNMPRKNMWERNARFYFPGVHKNYGSFLADTDHAIANATAMGKLVPAWGPQRYSQDQIVYGPSPPRSYKEDQFEWGVGEEADLITLQPMWDPSQTQWSYRYKIWNFVKGKVPKFSPNDPGDDAYYHPDFDKIPRRTFINTVVRFSSKLLHAMHMENRAGRAMQAEMWPATVALQHGLKAIYAPHPIWLDRKWPGWFLEATFNADHGEPAAWGQRNDSAYNHDREAAYRGWSWYYSTWFPRILYRRWLGWRARDILGDVGGADYEDHAHVLGDLIAGAEGSFAGGKGRMCLPAMLLHPVKNVKEDAGGDPQCARATDQDRRKERVVAAGVETHLVEKGFYWPDDVVVRSSEAHPVVHDSHHHRRA